MDNITIRIAAQAAGGRILQGNPDTPLAHIALDSRTMQGNDLFVPIIGERTDGHRFIQNAMEAGAVCAFTSAHDAPREEITGGLIRVEDTVKALQDLGSYIRGQLTIPVVGITGSVGKTTTRELTACALSAGFNTFKTPANHNSQVGLPMTISEIPASAEAAVLEMGMSNPGEMARIARVARPDVAIMTNIGVAHIENLGSRENILAEKLHIQDGMKPGGTLIVNGDNDLLKTVIPREGIKLIRYGLENGNEVQARDITSTGSGTAFTYVHGGLRLRVELSVPGQHNILNALAALCCAEVLGADPAGAAAALKSFHGFAGRQQIRQAGGITVLDDTYNASPDSVMAALRVLHGMKARRKIVVLADMLELGADAHRYHRDIGANLAGMRPDLLVCYGTLAREYAKGAFAAAGMRDMISVEAFDAPDDMDEMIRFLKGYLQEGDAVLFKGSNSMGLGRAAAAVLEEAGA